jgi:hypothetical protein
MKNTSVTKIFTTAALSSLLTLSTAAMAEQTKWLNPLSFTGGTNVKVSHDSPTYPGSLVVDIIAEEGAGEAWSTKNIPSPLSWSVFGILHQPCRLPCRFTRRGFPLLTRTQEL